MNKLISAYLSMSFVLFVCCGKRGVVNVFYEGKLSINISVNGASIMKAESLIYHDYMLEAQTTLIDFSQNTVGKNGEIVSNPHSIKPSEIVTGFTLSNFKDSTATTFDTLSKPTVKSVVSIFQKTEGILISKDLKQIAPFIDEFSFLKDTIMKGDHYKILISNLSEDKKKQSGFISIKLYLNTKSPNFPFHPVSSTLDRKFNGIIDNYSIVILDGQTINGEYNFKSGIEKSDRSKILKFINEATNYSLSHKKFN